VGYKKSITTTAYNNSKRINNEWKLSKLSYQLYITPSIRYYIDAYWAPFNIATIAYVRNHQLDSVNMLSDYSNTIGYQIAKLDNKLYQISMPIGLQWSFLPNSKIGVDAGITFLPTLT
jgi:hypothetical protein